MWLPQLKGPWGGGGDDDDTACAPTLEASSGQAQRTALPTPPPQTLWGRSQGLAVSALAPCPLPSCVLQESSDQPMRTTWGSGSVEGRCFTEISSLT